MSVQDVGLNECLNILSQQPGHRMFTPICSTFDVDDPTRYTTIPDTLENGIRALTSAFPWMAGKVVSEGVSKHHSGTYRIKANKDALILTVKDFREDKTVQSMETLRQHKFPASMLDEAVISPCRSLSGSCEESPTEPTPLLRMQANLISGGILLVIVAQHNAIDMGGHCQIMRLFSQACHGQPFSKEDLELGNISAYGPDLDLEYDDSEYDSTVSLAVDPLETGLGPNEEPEETDKRPQPKAPCTWANFNFSQSSLESIKNIATETISSAVIFVSTDDAIGAYIWQSISRVRASQMDHAATSTFSRAVDVRAMFGLPRQYPGLMSNNFYTTLSLEKLIEEPLGVVASKLRAGIAADTSDLYNRTRVLATLLNRATDKRKVEYNPPYLSTGLIFSSWTKFECYALDFNLGLGKPAAVRRPRFYPVESLMFMMPKDPHGDIAAAVCLREDDIVALRNDKDFMRHAEYIG